MKQQEIRWQFNPSYASHMSGIWERVIRSLRRVLVAITDRQALTDDVLSALFSEAEYVVNSRPLIQVVLDASGDEPLMPNHPLLLRSGDHIVGKFALKETITCGSDGVKCNISQECNQTWQTKQKLQQTKVARSATKLRGRRYCFSA